MTEGANRYMGGGRFTSRAPWIHKSVPGKYYELMLVTEGEMWMREDGVDYPLTKDMVLVLEPGKLREGYRVSKNRVSFYWIHFLDPDPNFSQFKKYTKIPDPQNLSMLCRQLTHYETKKFPSSVCQSLVHVLLHEYVRQCRDGAEIAPLPYRIEQWLNNNMDLFPSVSDVSDMFGYNPEYLSRVYKKAYGTTLKKAIDEKTMHKAKQFLLESDLSLTAISERLGMSDYKIFLKFFKYHEGVTPSEYRKLYRVIRVNNR